MTTDDDMREIEAALDEFQDASERVYEADQSPFAGDVVQQQKDARKALLAMIRQKLPQNDDEHERAVEAWHEEAMGCTYLGYKCLRVVSIAAIDDGVRLMRARPAIEPHTFTGLPDTTYEKLVAKEKAAGELLRAAKEAANWLLECDQDDDAQKLYAAIEAAERAGVR